MKKEYEAPKVITYSEDEIIDMLGPAQTCSPSPCPTYQQQIKKKPTNRKRQCHSSNGVAFLLCGISSQSAALVAGEGFFYVTKTNY